MQHVVQLQYADTILYGSRSLDELFQCHFFLCITYSLFLSLKMNSTATSSTQSVPLTSALTTSKLISHGEQLEANKNTEYDVILLVIYSVVLVIGTISLSVMMHFMRSGGTTSTTSITVLNLIFAHFIFLLTVPFRIYYYASNRWVLSFGWCKVVSGMIHIHMYMSFVLYVIILVTRLMMFHRKSGLLASPPRICAALVSVVVWILVFVMVTCIIYFSYGWDGKSSNNRNRKTDKCFNFGNIIKLYKEINYVISMLIILVSIVMAALQANVLWVLYRKHRQGITLQQDFGAQLNSLLFTLIVVFCFIPYHIFRLHYLEHVELENLNEVFLSLTTFICLDMLTFLGKRTCSICIPGNAI